MNALDPSQIQAESLLTFPPEKCIQSMLNPVVASWYVSRVSSRKHHVGLHPTKPDLASPLPFLHRQSSATLASRRTPPIKFKSAISQEPPIEIYARIVNFGFPGF